MKCRLTAATLLVAVVVTGCGSSDTRGGGDDRAGAAASPTSSAPDKIPTDFPTTVQVIDGKYKKGVSTAVTRNLTVLNASATAIDDAEKLLRANGWIDPRGKMTPDPKCERQTELSSKDAPWPKMFLVTLCSRKVGSGYELDYQAMGPDFLPKEYDN